MEEVSNEFETEVDRQAKERYAKFLSDKAEEEAKTAALKQAVEARFQALVASLENRSNSVTAGAERLNCENESPRSTSSRRLIDGAGSDVINREVFTPRKVRVIFQVIFSKLFIISNCFLCEDSYFSFR